MTKTSPSPAQARPAPDASAEVADDPEGPADTALAAGGAPAEGAASNSSAVAAGDSEGPATGESSATLARLRRLRDELVRLKADHAAQLAALKQENYTALAQSQTRYQTELSIQKDNHQREYAKLKARIAELEEQLAACRQAAQRMAAELAASPGEGGEQQPFEV